MQGKPPRAELVRGAALDAPNVRKPRWSDRDDDLSTAGPPADVQNLVVGMGLAALLGVAAWQVLGADPSEPVIDGGGGPGPFLRVARRVIPWGFGTPLCDEIFGDAIGPGRWKLYEKGYGATRGISRLRTRAG